MNMFGDNAVPSATTPTSSLFRALLRAKTLTAERIPGKLHRQSRSTFRENPIATRNLSLRLMFQEVM